ncbi:MAG TPA: hypothetical protein VNZ67_00835 [bacterium]|nr:hypothetical protein [bacterium]
MTADSLVQQTTHDTPAWRRWRLGRGLDQYDTEAGPLLTNLSRRERREPGRGLVNAGMALLGLLDAGLLYVVYAAQYAFIFSQKHEHLAAQVQALALDAAMIIFSVLALGLARKGLGAPAERAAIVACAAASAFMNWTAADQASVRSVAVYVAAPILLALTTDRTISVVRRHVLGMKDDASPWARLGRALGRVVLYALRAVVDFRGTRRGVKAAILAAAPLPEAEPGDLDVDHFAVLREELATGLDRIRAAVSEDVTRLYGELAAVAERQGRLELAAGASAYPTKKAHVLALYRARADYGHREKAGAAARALAGAAGVPASTARAYVYEELAKHHSAEEGQ